MIDLKAICDGLAARFAPGTLATPTGAVAIRASLAKHPKDVNAVPMAYLDVQDGAVVANSRWEHTINIDVVFLLSKRPGDPTRVDVQRQIWLPYLLAATEAQLKIGIGAQAGYEVAKAIPTGWEFTEENVGGTEYDAIRVHYQVFAYENVSLVA